MERLDLNFTPSFDETAVERGLNTLLVSGPLTDDGLDRRIERLSERFCIYSRYYPHGLWAPGLAACREMQGLTEIYLPMEEITRAFDRLFSRALRFPPIQGVSIVHGSTGWLDLLQRLGNLVTGPDPSRLLKSLMEDEGLRRRFIFCNFLPARHGGGFCRYPEQGRFLKGWLYEHRSRLARGVRCLDAACGTGEGTYGLLRLLTDSGFAGDSIRVEGSTMEPLELFAAAHACFPHDPLREGEYRRYVAPLVECGATGAVRFHLEELGENIDSGEERFDIILCNGLLGGPFLHDRERLGKILASLAGRLAPGGILLASDRFHGGWKRLVSNETLRGMLNGCGLELLPVAEGVGGRKAG